MGAKPESQLRNHREVSLNPFGFLNPDGGAGKAVSPSGFFLLFMVLALTSSGCSGLLATRPARHMSYAEAAFLAAKRSGADVNAPQNYQLARETLFRARAAYRLKNFREARRLAIRSRLLSEESEFRSMFKDVDPQNNPVTNAED